MPKPLSRALIVLFLAIVAMPLVANLAGVDGADPAAENRELTPFPRLNGTWTSTARFPGDLAAWFDDHFGFRARFVRWFGEVRVFAMRVSPSSAVALGKDGWLFYLDDFGLEDYANVRPMPAGEVANWRTAILRARDWMHARGGTYVFTIAPDKHVIYPEEFPDTVTRVEPISRASQLIDATSDCGVGVDLRPALLDAKQHERIYQLTDTHWNDPGAFAAYTRIIDAVRLQNPAVPAAWARSDFKLETRDVPGMDLAGMIGLTRVLRERDLVLTPLRVRRARVVEPAGSSPTAEQGRLVTEIPGSTLPRAVIFRDSFASRLVPFLSEHFSRAVYLWQNDFLPDDVVREGADVVIEEIVGRHLYGFIPSPELVPENAHSRD